MAIGRRDGAGGGGVASADWRADASGAPRDPPQYRAAGSAAIAAAVARWEGCTRRRRRWEAMAAPAVPGPGMVPVDGERVRRIGGPPIRRAGA